MLLRWLFRRFIEKMMRFPSSFCFHSSQEIQTNLKVGNKRPDWISTTESMSSTYLVWTSGNKSTIEQFLLLLFLLWLEAPSVFLCSINGENYRKQNFCPQHGEFIDVFLNKVRYFFAKSVSTIKLFIIFSHGLWFLQRHAL